jgi:hypothetical protein
MFAAIFSKDSLIQHAKSVHHVAECCPAITFSRTDLFHEHLIDTHTAKIGSWTENLENACFYQIFTSPPDKKFIDILENARLRPVSAYLDPGGGRDDSPPSSLFWDWKTTQETGALDFLHAFEGLNAYAGGLASESLLRYVRYHQIAETTLADIRMLSALGTHCRASESSTMTSKLQEAQERTRHHLKRVEFKRDTYREVCWREGYDVDEIYRALKTPTAQEAIPDIEPSDRRQEPTPEQQHMGWWDVLHHVRPQSWLTKKDRINSWLLQNLAAQPDEALRHRKHLQDLGVNEQLSEEEWARLVLKFWTLDGAAQPLEYSETSTNGAVNSKGAWDSSQFRLEIVALPIREIMEIESDQEEYTMDLGGPRKRKRGDK